MIEVHADGDDVERRRDREAEFQTRTNLLTFNLDILCSIFFDGINHVVWIGAEQKGNRERKYRKLL